MAIRAVLFDAGNTLVWLDHPYLAELACELGFQVTEEAVLDAEYAARATGVKGPRYFAEIFRQLGVPDDAFPALAQRLWARHAERDLWSGVREGTAETLEALRARGLKVGVVSNASGKVEELLETMGLRAHLDFVIDSTVVGVEKPDPRIFRLGLERAGVEPHEALYVGDFYEVDVVGARGVGMQALLIDPLDRFGSLDCERIAAIREVLDRLDAPA